MYFQREVLLSGSDYPKASIFLSQRRKDAKKEIYKYIYNNMQYLCDLCVLARVILFGWALGITGKGAKQYTPKDIPGEYATLYPSRLFRSQ